MPHPSDWSPDYTVFPYNLWQVRVTPEQIDAQRESCQWFNAQYGTLMTQIVGFQNFLGGRHDDWTAPGVQAAGDAVKANVDPVGGIPGSAGPHPVHHQLPGPEPVFTAVQR